MPPRSVLGRAPHPLLGPFDIILAKGPFLFGEAPIYSDFALFGVLGNMTYRNYNSLPTLLANLRGWFERMRTFKFDAATN